MHRMRLTWFACPALLAATLLAQNSAQANEVPTQSTKPPAPVAAKPLFEVVFERPTAASSQPETANLATDDAMASDACGCSSEPTLNFTEGESNAAIERFGCDCAGCLNALRQLQGKPPLL